MDYIYIYMYILYIIYIYMYYVHTQLELGIYATLMENFSTFQHLRNAVIGVTHLPTQVGSPDCVNARRV